MIGLISIDSHTGGDKFWYFLIFQIFMFETWKKMKSDKKHVFADIVYFDLVYHSEKKRENSNRGQKMSAKVSQRFLYSLPTLAPPPDCQTFRRLCDTSKCTSNRVFYQIIILISCWHIKDKNSQLRSTISEAWNLTFFCWLDKFQGSLWVRDRPRFFDQVGHQTTYACIGHRHFFTKSCHHQTCFPPKLWTEPTKIGHIFRKQSTLKIKVFKTFHV